MRGALAVAGITIVMMFLLTQSEVFHEFEVAARDAQARLLPARASDRVVLVEIRDDDYERLFGGVSPLDPAVVERLLSAIAAGGPTAIGVDLETSHPTWRGFRVPAGAPPIVWAREAAPCETEADVAGAGDGCGRGELVPLDYLGEKPPGALAGLVAFRPDPGGAIRTYQRVIETTDGPLPSFAWALYTAAGRNGAGTATNDVSPLSIDFRGGEPIRLAASTVLEWAGDSASGFSRAGIIRDRIVLLGGDYRAARDRHPTALGMMSGIEILAQVLETELDGGGRPAPSPFTIILLQSVTMMIVVFVFARFPFRTAFLLAALAVPVLALAAGALATGFAFSGIAYFLPLLVVMLVHLIYDQANEYRKGLMVELMRQAGSSVAAEWHVPLLDHADAGVTRSIVRAAAVIRGALSATRSRLRTMRTGGRSHRPAPSRQPSPRQPTKGAPAGSADAVREGTKGPGEQ